MNDSQIISIAIIFVAALGSIMFNNSRISDMGKRIDDLRDSLNQHIDDKFTLLSQQLKTMEDNIMGITGDLETRVHKLEHPK